MKKITKIILASIISAVLFSFAACDIPEYPSDKKVIPGSINGKEPSTISGAEVSSTFMRGVDVSEVKALESAGVSFKENGQKKDIFSILASHGVTWVRIRIWNDYTKELGGTHQPYGFNDLNSAVDMAKRAKKAGLKVLLDFHYSDTWADPSNQKCPDAWKSIDNLDDLKAAVKTYTVSVLTQMKTENCLPDMIQIGNEMEGGILKTNTAVTVTTSDSCEIVKEVAAAVKAYDSSVKTMIHMSRGGNATVLANFYNNFIKNNPDVDVVGLSYYPFYESHGTIAALKANIEKIAKSYGKQCVIAETSYGYSPDVWMDSLNNEFWTDDEETSVLTLTDFPGIKTREDGTTKYIPATVENQAAVTRYIMENAYGAGATGLFYWGGCYLAKENSTDSSRTMKSNWENQALFGTDGNVLDSIDVFN